MAREPDTQTARRPPPPANVNATRPGDRDERVARAPASDEQIGPQTTRHYHSLLGNDVVQGALNGETIAGLGPLVAADMALGAVGMPGESMGSPNSSNQAMLGVMRRADDHPGQEEDASGAVEQVLRRAGQPLPSPVRARLEAAFGRDLAGVRVHTDAAANRAARGVNAVAFTQGEHIVFGPGAFQPGTPTGDEILGHEVTHVVQHLEGRTGQASDVEGGVPVTTPGDTVEREAEHFGQAFAQQGPELPEAPLLDREVQPDAGLDAAAPSPEAPVARLTARDPGDGSGQQVDQTQDRARTSAAAQEAAQEVRKAVEEHERNERDRQAQMPSQDTEHTNPDRPQTDGVATQEDAPTEVPEPNLTIEQQEEADAQAQEEDGEHPSRETEGEEAQDEEEIQGEDVGVGDEEVEAPPEGTDGNGPEADDGSSGTGNDPPGGGGGGGGAAGGGGGGGGGGPVELDGFVDYYMETHWDRSEYDAKIGELDLEMAGLTGSTLDRFLPAETPPGVRSALNLVTGAGAAGLDAMFTGAMKAIPGIGSIFHIAHGIKDIWSSAETYSQLDDNFGMWVNIIRNVADLVGSVVGNLGDLATVVEDVAAISVVGAPLAAVVAFCGTWGDAIGATCDTIKTTCSVISLVHNVVQAQEAERNRDFRRAGQYRTLARGSAIDAVVDFIGLVSTLGSMGTANALPGEVGEDMAEAAGKTFREIAGDKALSGMLGVKSDTVGTVGEQINRGKDSWLTGTQSFGNLMYHMGLGDAMAYSTDGLFGGHYIEPSQVSGDGQVAGILGAARDATQGEFDTAWADLEGDNPKWTQKLINDITNPQPGSALQAYSDFLSPSAWIGRFAGWGADFLNSADTATHGGVAAFLRANAQLMDQFLGPGIETLAQWIRDAKEPLDLMAENLAEALRQQEVSLQAIRDSIPHVNDFLEKVNTIADAGGTVHNFAETAASTVEGWHMTGDRLGIPSWVPSWTYQWALDAFNSLLNRIASGIRNVRDQWLPQIDQFVESQTSWAQDQLTSIEDAVREGGEVETMLQEAHRTVVDGVASLLEAFADWEVLGEIDFAAAVDWCVEAANRWAQNVEDQGFQARLDEFKEYMRSTAQQAVDQWKADHADSVEQAYAPEVPQGELDAVGQAWQIISARMDELADEQPDWHANNFRLKIRAQLAYRTALAQGGQSGQQAMDTFWSNANILAEVASAIGC
ncbi:MAG: DUF4157 domain-containing protein [Alphaproteobacteria bacterium]|nr:DUF4157 domain-containing protein [Alphaproteobacteria bacterium]